VRRLYSTRHAIATIQSYKSVKNGNAAKPDAQLGWLGCSRSVSLTEAPDVGAGAALIHRIRKPLGGV